MIKKAIHHFNRGLMIGFEIIGFLAIVVVLCWAGLLWRLSQGPLDIGFLADKLETAMNERQTGFHFDIGQTFLTWGGKLSPFEVDMRAVKVDRTDGTPVMTVDRLGVQLSKRHLVFGQLMPRTIKIYAPSFRVMRWDDGHFSFNLDAAPLPVAGPPLPPDLAVKAAETQVELVRGVLAQLRDRTGVAALLGGLREISVSNAKIYYEDKALNASWFSHETDIVINRRRGGLQAAVQMSVELADDQHALWTANVTHVWDKAETAAVVNFYDLDLGKLSERSEAFKPIAGLKVPLRGAVKFVLDRDFRPDGFEFVLGGEAGSFSGFGLYEDAPLPLSSFYAAGSARPRLGRFEISQLKINTGGPKLQAQVVVERDAAGVYTALLDGVLEDTPMDDLHIYWPEALATDARAWVTQHLSAGTAHRATIAAAATYDPLAEGKKLAVKKLGGEIMFDGIKVDYFPPLMPVLGAQGRAFYDADAFNLDISGGKLGDMKATKSTIHITQLSKLSPTQHAEIDIAVSLKGPLKTALSVLDSKPLEYPKMLGINSADVAGDADVDVTFKFPIHKKLDIREVHVRAEAKAHDVVLKNIVAGLTLSGGPMDLVVDNGAVNVKGQALLTDVPVKFDWSKNFNTNAAFDQKVTAKLNLNTALLEHFGLPDVLEAKGQMASDVIYQAGFDGKARLDLKSELSGMALTIPMLDFKKQANASGTLSLNLTLLKNNLQRIDDLSLETAGILLAGDLSFNRDAKGETALKKATFSNLMFGETQIAVEADDRGAEGLAVKVTGSQFDASAFMGDKDAPAANSDAAAAKIVTPLQISMAVKRLLLGKDKALTDVKMFLKRNKWQRLDQMEVDATVGGKALYLRYMPEKAGHSLRFEADNAGAALAVFGISQSIRGGKLALYGEPNPKGGPRDLTGTVQIGDFTLKDTPVLAKLLNAMSLVGVLDLLNGSGLSFKKARANFSYTDRGQPDQQKNVRLINVRDGRTSGTSLGLTFEGQIDYWARQFDLNGTIIPVSEVSSIISGIPLVGDILTAGGEGLLAATYTIRGSMSQPSVVVNPLAVLAPGILRKIFFE